MPTYDYQCTACDHQFEEFQSISAPVKRKCPACGELKLKRLIGAGAAVMFKGSGFYQTDYRSESYKKRAAEEKSSSSGTKTDKANDAAPKSKKKSPDAGKATA
jgi:putative FmdB family regulatory protein